MIRRLGWRLRSLWVQKVRHRSGRFDHWNDPVFVPICPDCFTPFDSDGKCPNCTPLPDP